jgi:hypothetical protein
MYLTRALVEKIIQPGDGIGVVYRKVDGVARLLRAAEGGRAIHWIECLGGLDTFEETIGGGMATRLDTYLQGNCDLIVKRVRGGLDLREKKIVLNYWDSLVGKGYGWDSIKRSAVTVPIRRFVRPHFPRTADVMVAVARAALPGKMPDCSAAWVAGLRLANKNVMLGYEPEEVSPEDLVRDRELVEVEYWKKPILLEEKR